MIIFDSNIWIAYLNLNDPCHKQANQFFEKQKGVITIPEYILLEVSSVLKLKANREIANNFLKIAQNNINIEILPSSPHLLKETIQLFQNNNNKLSFADNSLLYYAINHSATIITLDKELNKVLSR